MATSVNSSSRSQQTFSLASAWSSDTRAKEAEKRRTYDESREAITHDPITALPFDRPLIDPCGHTYDRETVLKFKKLGANVVECPVSRRAVRIDQFVPNLYAENVLNYMAETERRSSSSSSSSSSSTSSSTTSTPVTAEAPTAPSGTTLDDLAGMLGQVLQRVDDLTTNQRLMHRQITNLVGMSYCDRVVSLVKCNHFASVRDRGLTEEEKRRINT